MNIYMIKDGTTMNSKGKDNNFKYQNNKEIATTRYTQLKYVQI